MYEISFMYEKSYMYERSYMYGEELRPDQMSMSRTFEAVWMMPLENPNKKEISCKREKNYTFLSLKKSPA